MKKYNATYPASGHAVRKGQYLNREPFKTHRASRPVAGAVAEYEGGSSIKGATGTRMAAGAVIAGPVGLLVGGLLKKDKSKGYVTITFPDGEVIRFEDTIKYEGLMRNFVNKVNEASQHFAELEAASNPSQATSSSHPAATASSLTAQDEHQGAQSA